MIRVDVLLLIFKNYYARSVASAISGQNKTKQTNEQINKTKKQKQKTKNKNNKKINRQKPPPPPPPPPPTKQVIKQQAGNSLIKRLAVHVTRHCPFYTPLLG